VAAFVSVSQLEAALQRPLVGAAASEALDEACQTVRDYLGQRLDFVQNDTVTLHGTGRATLLLPELPVSAIGAVTVTDADGVATVLGAADWSLDGIDGVLWRHGDIWPAGIHNVAVSGYGHGYASVPASIRGVALSLANRIYGRHASKLGVRSEQLAAYSYVNEPTSGTGLDGLEQTTLDRYKVRRIPAA
jgi:hypothetical protein